MFDIGLSELALVFIIALVVLGPERLPKAARSLGQWMGRARAAFNHIKAELDREVMNREMEEKFRQRAAALQEDQEQFADELRQSVLGDSRHVNPARPTEGAVPPAADAPAVTAASDEAPRPPQEPPRP